MNDSIAVKARSTAQAANDGGGIEIFWRGQWVPVAKLSDEARETVESIWQAQRVAALGQERKPSHAWLRRLRRRPQPLVGPPDVRASYGGQVIPFPNNRRPTFRKFCVETANGPKFRVPLLGKYIKESLPVAAGGGELYIYDGGVYRPGEPLLKRLITDLLGVDWTAGRSRETIDWLLAQADKLNEAPPADVINVRNGLLHVSKRGEVTLKPHDPKFRTVVQLPVTYDESAACPVIGKFLDTVFPSPAVRSLIEEVSGYVLVPDNSLQKAVMFRGPGGNGKSVYLSLLSSLIGGQNVAHRQLQDLDENRFAPADLYGKLANICADLSSRELQSSSI